MNDDNDFLVQRLRWDASEAAFELERLYKKENEVCDYIVNDCCDGQIGCGDDPIGFLIASHRALRMKIEEMKK